MGSKSPAVGSSFTMSAEYSDDDSVPPIPPTPPKQKKKGGKEEEKGGIPDLQPNSDLEIKYGRQKYRPVAKRDPRVGYSQPLRRIDTAQAKTTAAIDEAEKLRKWHDWAKASEVVSLQGELDVVKQERDMLQRDLQSRLAESRRLTTQNEEWAKDVKALRSDVFAREGKLGRCEAELAALNRSLKQSETELMVARSRASAGRRTPPRRRSTR